MQYVTGPRARSPRAQRRAAVPGRPPQARAVGGGRVLYPGNPSRGHEAPLPGALLLPPQRAKPARKSVRCGIGDGPPRPHPPRSRQRGSWRRPSEPRTGGGGRESARPRTRLTEARGPPPGAPLCRPHSVQSQLARACTVELVTGNHVHTPLAHGKRAAGPSCLPQRWTVGAGRVPNPGHASLRHEAPAPGRPRAAPAALKASSQDLAM